MTERWEQNVRDDRYRRAYQQERWRAEHYRDLLLGVVVVLLGGGNLSGVDWADHLDADDLAEVARRRRRAQTGRRTG